MGFIKLDRALFENPLWTAEPFTKAQAWVDLIQLANFADKTKYYRGSFHEIKRGQIVTSQRTLAERWKWSKAKVATFIRTLEDAAMVTTDNTNRWTVLTIVNYAKYQDGPTTKRPQKRPQNDHEATTERPQKGLQEEYKNKETPNGVYIPTRGELADYVREEGLDADPDEIFDYYEAVGWRVGSKPVKDWKALCRKWRSYEKPKKKQTFDEMMAEAMQILDERDRKEGRI